MQATVRDGGRLLASGIDCLARRAKRQIGGRKAQVKQHQLQQQRRRLKQHSRMEPFAYEDYSDFDTDELDFDPSLRRVTTATNTRRSLRSSSPFELDVDEAVMAKIRSRARQATSDFLDSCDAMRQKAKIRDEDALRKFDAAIELPLSAPRRGSSRSLRRDSLGLPPLMPRATRGGSLASDMVNTNNSSPVRRASLGSNSLTTKASSSGPDSETNLSPLHEKLPRGPVIRSRFVRSVTPESRFLVSPRKRSAPYFSTALTEPDIRERISTRRKMRDVESRLDKILDYELPYASGFKEMRNTLREINDKMAKHRLLIDRYSGLQINEDNEPVADRVAAKVDELIPRVPALSGVQNPFKLRSDEITSSFDPRLIPGYSTGLCVTPSEGTRELRGRIRNLLCRTRDTSRQDAANPYLRPFSTNHRNAGVVAE
ncbi:hypothetical protein EGR_00267 [Echinococcus granulosus]|uniref:Uncharacterized protein n=1 Tax=Echinococcus granulosus TaxID=6210 RepID=W6UUP2_ECHGR|nr:hypothetical protein EGR_00267 [Echinococcus granulosus]EUB64998.1 hypothetical protein EGR_00267 [Echinococcus granulosus]